MELPPNIDVGKKNRTISADKCCVKVLKHLWANGIETLSHCCGHGKLNPSIVIADAYGIFDILEIENLIAQVDNRQWELYQWQLIKVAAAKE